ncbi:hypothetical protein C2E21_1340 [Chlorella sorokiniana]|uniref:Uncharacterized protein n=1 Tax=Chlorella sorokiniana TaxID=3076 RepID=A0A2P6U0Z9_CHLSO|nr:hypothetical protein C2E21_1340 [Chlorella sorokiniana]|eukprot:PRW59989.1 hypothetical protein C2E21_1340 [Chlorella sorokiniana]
MSPPEVTSLAPEAAPLTAQLAPDTPLGLLPGLPRLQLPAVHPAPPPFLPPFEEPSTPVAACIPTPTKCPGAPRGPDLLAPAFPVAAGGWEMPYLAPRTPAA